MTTLASARFVADLGERIIDGATAPALPAIDSGIPIPRLACNRGTYVKYPWKQMKVGDSFVFPAKANHRTTVERATSLANYRKKAQGESYLVRSVEEGGVRVVRVWRVA